MKLFQDKVLVRKDPEETKVGGLFLVETKSGKEPLLGTVVQCGPGKVFCERDKDGVILVKGAAKTQLKPGDRVLCQRNTEYNIKVNNEWLLLFKEADVFGVLDEAD